MPEQLSLDEVLEGKEPEKEPETDETPPEVEATGDEPKGEEETECRPSGDGNGPGRDSGRVCQGQSSQVMNSRRQPHYAQYPAP